MLEAADIVQKLYLVAQDLPAEKFGVAKKKIEAKYDEVERNLIEEFAFAQKEENIQKMKELANIMSQFKGYSQCIDVYIEQSQAVSFIWGRKSIRTYDILLSFNRLVIVAKMYLRVLCHFVVNIMKLLSRSFPVPIK